MLRLNWSKRCRWNSKQCRPCRSSLISDYTVCPGLFVWKLKIFEPYQEIMALFVLRKLLKMRSHPVGLDVWFLVGPFVYFHTTYVRAKSLVTYVISTIVIWTGSNHVLYLMFYVSVDSGPEPAVQPVWLHTADMAECSVENSVKIKPGWHGRMDGYWWMNRQTTEANLTNILVWCLPTDPKHQPRPNHFFGHFLKKKLLLFIKFRLKCFFFFLDKKQKQTKKSSYLPTQPEHYGSVNSKQTYFQVWPDGFSSITALLDRSPALWLWELYNQHNPARCYIKY